MSGLLSTSVSFPFAPQAGSGDLALYNGGGVVGLNALPLTLIDTVPGGILSLYATVGAIEDTGKEAIRIEGGSYTQMNGVDQIQVPVGAKWTIKLAFSEMGIPVTPQVLRVAGETVYFHQKFWGMVEISSYQRVGKLLRYRPERLGGTGGAAVTNYGTVAAYKDGHLAICDVNAMGADNGKDELEVYRIESKALINADGEWELPEGWPDDPSYPNGANPPKPRVGVVTTRVHEVGMVSAQGMFWSRTFSISNQQPYKGDESYKPKTSVVKGKGFSKLSSEMQVKAMEVMASRGKGEYAS